MNNTIHVITKTLPNGERGRVFGDMNDTEFEKAFAGITIPATWKISHLAQSEIDSKNSRWKTLAEMPILTRWDGYNLTVKEAVEMIHRDYQDWKRKNKMEAQDRLFSAAFKDTFDGLFDTTEG